jgi:hypothetical protein
MRFNVQLNKARAIQRYYVSENESLMMLIKGVRIAYVEASVSTNHKTETED